MYVSGRGVPQDDAEAARWYRKAAEQGNAAAQFLVGLSYSSGEGVPQDYAEAVRWFRKAADHGNASAQFSLGVMYSKGQGVPQDYAEAHMWFNLAASRASGDDQKKFSDARELVAKKMTAEQIAGAQRRAREWKPKSGENKGGKPVK
jgi:TPR repeat protein